MRKLPPASASVASGRAALRELKCDGGGYSLSAPIQAHARELLNDKAKRTIEEWRENIISRGSSILAGLRTDEKLELMRMSLEMLKMQMQNDKRFADGMSAPCTYLWESHLSILGMMVSIVFPWKLESFKKSMNGADQRAPRPASSRGRVYELLLSLNDGSPEEEVDLKSLIAEASKLGISRPEVDKALEKLIIDGVVYRPSSERIRLLNP